MAAPYYLSRLELFSLAEMVSDNVIVRLIAEMRASKLISSDEAYALEVAAWSASKLARERFQQELDEDDGLALDFDSLCVSSSNEA